MFQTVWILSIAPLNSRAVDFQAGLQRVALYNEDRIIAVSLQIGRLSEKTAVGNRYDEIGRRFALDSDNAVDNDIAAGNFFYLDVDSAPLINSIIPDGCSR